VSPLIREAFYFLVVLLVATHPFQAALQKSQSDRSRTMIYGNRRNALCNEPGRISQVADPKPSDQEGDLADSV
jgi:hypothetical protein